MSGGYVCGASSKSQGAGIMVNANGNASTLNLTGGVIAANYAPQGAGVYSAYSNVSISENAVISGNATFNGANDQAGYGGGIMAVGGSVAVSGGYITNNRMAKFCGEDGSGNHGGAGLAPITAPMSPFPVARLLAIILKKPVAAFTLPIKGEAVLARIWHGSTLREDYCL